MSPSHPALDGFPVVLSIPLLWGDQDSLNHVNNIIYFKWAETARIEYLRRVPGWDGFERAKVGPIVAAISCNYRRPLTYPDTVRVGARVTAIGNSSFRMEHRVVSENQGVVAAELESTLVIVDYAAGKPVRIPDDARQAVRELEGRDIGA